METTARPDRPLLPSLFAPVPDLDPVAYERLARGVRDLLDIDLTQYKAPQVWRRVNGFASSRGFAGPDALLDRAREDAVLRQAFLDMLTINVSEFFRNPEAWEMLRDRFLAPLLRDQASVKIWSAGCSLGFEPYTIAMLIRELAPRANARILATDLDETILNRARRSRYTEQQMTGVSAARRARFFEQTGELWEVRPELRAMVMFRRHDLLKDAHEKDFDIVVCRNVVIYFTEEAKTQLYRRFGEALKPGGVLFLGATESIPNVRSVGLAPIVLTFYGRARN